MIRAPHKNRLRTLMLGFCTLCCAGTAVAQLPYKQSFMTSSAPGLVYGGSPSAYLTAGVIDPATDGYLRLTANATGAGGYVYSNSTFPVQNGLKLSFEYFVYGGGGNPADGFSFFLFDGATTSFNIGAYGLGLGYQSDPSNGTPGLSNGYLGIGFDVYGNSSNANGGPGSRPNYVTLRGPASTSYHYDANASAAAAGFNISSGGSATREPDSTQPNYRRAIIQLIPKAVAGGYSYDISVTVVTGGVTPVYHALSFNGSTTFTGFADVAPVNLRYGFAGSTGGLKEAHEIRNLHVEAYSLPAGTPVANNDSYSIGCGSTVFPLAVLNNDLPANAPLAFDSTSVLLIDPSNPANSGNSYTIAGVGTFTTSSAFGAQGNVYFTPLSTFSGTASIQYMVKDNYGISSNAATITVDGAQRAILSAAVITNAACHGSSNGSVVINGSTNPAGYTYANGAGAYGSSGTFSGFAAGTYTLHTKNSFGCILDVPVTITEPAVLSTAISGSPVSAGGPCNTYTIFQGYGAQYLTLSSSTSGGTGPYSYSWTPSASAGSVHSATTAVSPTATTLYTLSVTDANNCPASATFNVKVKDIHCGPKYVGRELNNTVYVCDGGVSLCISPSAVPAHLANAGACLGSCGSGSTSRSIGTSYIQGTGAVTVYPNPASSSIHVLLNDMGGSWKAWQIMDITGRIIAQQHLTDGIAQDVLTIDITKMVQGIYLIRVAGDDRIATSRFSVE